MEREVDAGPLGGCGLLWGVLVGTAAQKDRKPHPHPMSREVQACVAALPFPCWPSPWTEEQDGCLYLHEEWPGRGGGGFYPGNKQSQVWGLSQTSTQKGKELGLPLPAHRAQVLD